MNKKAREKNDDDDDSMILTHNMFGTVNEC